MQFLIMAKDATDPGSAERRSVHREAHLARAVRLQEEGGLLYGVALLDAQEQMCGSVMVVEFPSRTELEDWLAEEPYLAGQVWQSVEVIPCRVGPMFLGTAG